LLTKSSNYLKSSTGFISHWITIIWASARHAGVLLVTRNSRDFPPDHPGVRIPYKV